MVEATREEGCDTMDIREFGRERTRQATTLIAIGSVLGVGTVFGVAAADIAATKAAAANAASAGTTTSSGTTQRLPERRESDDGTSALGLPGREMTTPRVHATDARGPARRVARRREVNGRG